MNFSQLMKSQMYTEKSNFDFLIKIKLQRLQFIKTCQNMKIVHKEIKKSRFHFEKSKFLNLEIFLSVGNSHFFITLSQIFTMMQDDSKETSKMKDVDLNEI